MTNDWLIDMIIKSLPAIGSTAETICREHVMYSLEAASPEPLVTPILGASIFKGLGIRRYSGHEYSGVLDHALGPLFRETVASSLLF